MTTQTITPITPLARQGVLLVPVGSADETKLIAGGCGKLILLDNTHNGNAVTYVVSTRADIYGRTTDPYGTGTVDGGAVKVLGPFSSELYGQTADHYTDVIITITATAGGKLAVPGEVAAAQSTGGSIGNADYDYYVTAVNANDLETNASAKGEVTVAAGGGTASVIVSWEAVAGAAAYRIYGRTNGATGKLLHTFVASPVIYPAGTAMSWTDTGAIAESAIEPPAANAASDSKSFSFLAALAPTQA